MAFGQATIGGCLAGGMISAAAAALIWLPLSASWRQPELRRRRLAAGAALAMSAALFGVATQRLVSVPIRGAAPLLIWFLGYQTWTLILIAVIAVSNRLRSGVWWSYALADSPQDRRLWALVPAITCFVVAAVLGLTDALYLLSAERLQAFTSRVAENGSAR